MRMPPKFPEPYRHEHPPVQDVNTVLEGGLTFGQRCADYVAASVGSWAFLIAQTVIVVLWVGVNVVAFVRHWDPYPFILLNLALSVQAAYTAPLIMMSQNRQATKDRLEAYNDYQINQKTEEEVRAILDHLEAQDRALAQLLEEVEAHRKSG